MSEDLEAEAAAWEAADWEATPEFASEQHMKQFGDDLGEHAIWCKAAFAIAAKNKAETIRAADGMGDDCTQYVLEELDAAKRYFDGLTTIIDQARRRLWISQQLSKGGKV